MFSQFFFINLNTFTSFNSLITWFYLLILKYLILVFCGYGPLSQGPKGQMWPADNIFRNMYYYITE